MSADKLAKELQQFERMTKAVLTVGEAVKEGMLKKQTLKNLESSIEEKLGKSKKLDQELKELELKIDLAKSDAKAIILEAKGEVKDILDGAAAEVDLIKSEGRKAKSKLSTSIKERSKAKEILEGELLSITKEIANQKGNLEAAKKKIRSLID